MKTQTFQSVLVQLQVSDNLWAEQREDVRRARELEPRNDFLRDGGAADQVPLLQHTHLLTSLYTTNGRQHVIAFIFMLLPVDRESGHLGKIRGRHEPVVPASDHDRIPIATHC